jgi:RNA polymerase sigma-70 factor, ECF subfamily
MVKDTSTEDERAKRLLSLVAKGDERAFAQLFEMFSSRVFAFTRRMLRDESKADEVMVDTMYEVWKTAANYRGDAKMSTWVLGIARNKALMALRSGSVTSGHVDIDDMADLLESDAPDGLAVLEAAERDAYLAHCLDRLNEKHRECIHLVHYETLSLMEAGKVLCIPEGTVKSRLSTAKQQLSACLAVKLGRA